MNKIKQERERENTHPAPPALLSMSHIKVTCPEPCCWSSSYDLSQEQKSYDISPYLWDNLPSKCHHHPHSALGRLRLQDLSKWLWTAELPGAKIWTQAWLVCPEQLWLKMKNASYSGNCIQDFRVSPEDIPQRIKYMSISPHWYKLGRRDKSLWRIPKTLPL